MSKPYKRLTGQKFGQLLVLDKYENRDRKYYWQCKCDCGNIRFVRSTSLVSGISKHCGCMIGSLISKSKKGKKYTRRKLSSYRTPVKSLSGKRFGKLLVLNEYRRIMIGKSIQTQWLCQCDCGQTKWIQRSPLVWGSSTSCGCYGRQRVSESRKIKPGLAATRRVYEQYKLRAERKELIFDFNFENFVEITSKNCVYCGSEPSNNYSVEGRNGSFIYNGIDRINNNLGYTSENSVTCCKICNRAKDVLTKEQFLQWIEKAYLFNKKENL